MSHMWCTRVWDISCNHERHCGWTWGRQKVHNSAEIVLYHVFFLVFNTTIHDFMTFKTFDSHQQTANSGHGTCRYYRCDTSLKITMNITVCRRVVNVLVPALPWRTGLRLQRGMSYDILRGIKTWWLCPVPRSNEQLASLYTCFTKDF